MGMSIQTKISFKFPTVYPTIYPPPPKKKKKKKKKKIYIIILNNVIKIKKKIKLSPNCLTSFCGQSLVISMVCLNRRCTKDFMRKCIFKERICADSPLHLLLEYTVGKKMMSQLKDGNSCP